MPHLTEFFENVQLPTMPDVPWDLLATMQGDDIPFEKVRNAIARDPALTAMLIRLANSARFGLEEHVAMLLAEIGLEEPKSPADTIASLPEEIKRALQLDSAWLAELLPLVALWMCLCADAGLAKTCVSIRPKRKAPRGLSCVRA